LRQSRTVNGATTQYAYDGVRLLKELDAAGATQTSYTLAPLGDEWYPLVSDRKAGASRFYAFDALGTTRALTNQSQLTTHQFTDDAYGNLLSAPDPTATPHQNIGKLGYYADAASGLQLLTQRYYDPAVGRFVTEDPVREGGNWYAYVGARPVTEVDPTGLLGWQAVPCVVGMICEPAMPAVWNLGCWSVCRHQPTGYGYQYCMAECTRNRSYGPTQWICHAMVGTCMIWTGYQAWRGVEYPMGPDMRLAPWGNRTGHRWGRYPHYHRRICGPNGQTCPGGSMRWHRPWEKGW